MIDLRLTGGLSIKRVAGEINEFEINYYNNSHNLILTFVRVFTNRATTIAYQRIFRFLFDLIFQLTNLLPQFKHIHGTGNILNKKYDNNITNNMLALLTADSEDAINKLFDNIQLLDENLKDWVLFYKQKWVITSLNKNISQIDDNIWRIAHNTNIAEAAHALIINVEKRKDTNESNNEESSKSDKLEYLERKLALKECELDL
ncbi:hypothetical protein C2G38_2216138 [Gigaspora rosea]|uniref:Uncharacterized protein n=1 Tax=Gigaspora rosea TaxID=44941 RepID=A0A397UI44_9GLOM|nr:hypothetical protein C2G38_2216138 [Gigaspora rosea]